MPKPTRLERIFIRSKNTEGKWESVNLASLDAEQFKEWYSRYLGSRLADAWTRDECLQHLDQLGISPVEIKESAYGEDGQIRG